MFGKNPIRSQITDPRELAVESIFYTIQGEGPFSGLPALFIRLAGCNLACIWCDTQFENMADEARPIGTHLAHILKAFTPKQRKLVVLTGGEPLRQNPSALIQALLNTGTETVQIETAGTLQPSVEILDLIATKQVVLVCSPKTPKVNASIAAWCQHWKYVVRAGEVSPADGLPNTGTQRGTCGSYQIIYRDGNAAGFPTNIWISPCDDYDVIKNKKNQDLARDLCLQYGYRLSLQVHKIVGVE